MEQPFVVWEDRFNVGISSIDLQHKKLIDLTNRLYLACQKGKDEAMTAFKAAVKEAVDYVKFHFADEEKLMTSNSYTKYLEHKLEHEDFVKKVILEISNFEAGKPFVANTFVRYLRDWLLEHIAITDKELGGWLTSHGVR